MIRSLSALLLLLALLSPARANESRAMIAAQQILDQARTSVTDCTRTSEALVRILCAKQLRVGLRSYYPGFSVRDQSNAFSGFEVDIARRIADFLGVRLVPVAVDTKTRIPLVADGDIDLVIATMSHNVQRDGEVRFVLPHYYESQSVLVGARSSAVHDWDDLVGQTVCLPSGALANIMLARHHIRILTFDQPEQLLDALEFNQCAFVMHDNTFFAEALTRPDWTRRFAVKFGFAPMPWGMAVARTGAMQLAALLDELSAGFHADGVFLRLARDHGVDDVFLGGEQRRWASPRCIAADGTAVADCLIPPADTSDANDISMMAAPAKWLEEAAKHWLGLRLDLSPLKHQSAVGLLLEGVGYSLSLVVGVVLTTSAFALSLAWLMTHGPTAMRRGFTGLAAIGQTSPLPLLLFFGYVVAGGVTQYNGFVALGAAVVVIGFYNGANAGQAIKDAHQAAQGRSFLAAVSAAGIQLFAFLINATKGSPAAGMIGVPEFLNVMTDLTAYSRGRVAVYLTLLLFYTGLVLAVIALLSRLERWLGDLVRPPP
ncbi:MAG: transporter substrate-binding domain-containing protein [Acetobacteraceae bacterium]|jgi:polar amino acid transport system substrate-binding protein